LRPLVLGILIALGAGAAIPSAGQPPADAAAEPDAAALRRAEAATTSALEDASLHRALVALPLSAALAGVLAYRPRRRNLPERNPEVVQTQIMLAIVGALVMLVVGASLARAFGIAGAASLVRYRAKVSDPKDASVMLSALGIGLASGVGLYWLASAATAFIVLVLAGLEWVEPRPHDEFQLKVRHRKARELRPQIERLLRRARLRHELRTSADDELTYAVQVPVGRSLKPISDAMADMDRENHPGIEWDKED
jgi:hypothetical protein